MARGRGRSLGDLGMPRHWIWIWGLPQEPFLKIQEIQKMGKKRAMQEIQNNYIYRHNNLYVHLNGCI